MSKDRIIEAWKNPELRASLSSEELKAIPDNPAGSLARELDESELALLAGGRCGPGRVPSVTGDCTCPNGITACSWSFCC